MQITAAAGAARDIEQRKQQRERASDYDGPLRKAGIDREREGRPGQSRENQDDLEDDLRRQLSDDDGLNVGEGESLVLLGDARGGEEKKMIGGEP